MGNHEDLEQGRAGRLPTESVSAGKTNGTFGFGDQSH